MNALIGRVESALRDARQWLRANWLRALRIRQRVRVSEETFHLILAGCIGVLGGLINLVFYLCIEFLLKQVKRLTLGHGDDVMEVVEAWDPWVRFLIPAAGALAAGLVLHWGLQLIGRVAHSTNLLEAVGAGDGRLRLRPTIIKSVSSLISIGTGASIGREGAITQLTATLASRFGQSALWEPYRLRLLVGCGAAAGLSAAYNAPIAGAVFAALIVLGSFSMHLFVPLIFASVVATMVSRTFFGIEPWYDVPRFDFTNLSQLPWFLVLSVAAGCLGAFFLKVIAISRQRFQKLQWPIHAKLALGGALMGFIAMGYPLIWGNGYGAANRILHGNMAWDAVMLLLVAKLVASAIAVGVGTIGGLMTPTLLLGAALGSLFGMALHAMGCALVLPTGAFALVGMASVLAATLHSPLLAMILVFEISLNYSLMPPLMLGCALASVVARRLHPDSVYAESLRLRELEVARESSHAGMATDLTVGDLMHAPVPPIRENTPMPQIAERFLTSAYNFLPVVDEQGGLVGVVALQDLKEYLAGGPELSLIIAYDVMRPSPRCLTPSQKLPEALPVLLASEQRNIPVVNNMSEKKLIGAVPKAEALGRLSEAISPGSSSGLA
ncbi:MAG TPA: chloride channel protein [Verrucomicrobiae bacterium]